MIFTNPLHCAGYCLDAEFHAFDHTTRPEALTKLYTMCDEIHGEASAKAHWTGNVFAYVPFMAF